MQKITNLAIGDKIKLGTIYGHDIVWVLADKHNHWFGSGVYTLLTQHIIAFLPWDARRYYGRGWHRWDGCNLKQWLNSSAGANSWYSAQSADDNPPKPDFVSYNHYFFRPGFLNGFTADEINALLVLGIDTPETTYAGFGRCRSRRLACKVFIPSIHEYFLEYRYAIFKSMDTRFATPTEDAVTNSSKCRSINFGQGMLNNFYYLSNDIDTSDNDTVGGQGINDDTLGYKPNNTFAFGFGSVDNSLSPYNIYAICGQYYQSGRAPGYNHLHIGVRPDWGDIGIRPAVNISSDNWVTDAPDADGCYRLVFNAPPPAPEYIRTEDSIYIGDTVVSWGQSVDPDGDAVGYALERAVNGGSYTEIYNGSAQTYTDTLASGTTTVQYRVKAYDTRGGTSAYTATSEKTVITNRLPIVTISTPPSGVYGNTNNFTAGYTVTDADGDIVTATVYLDGAEISSGTVTLGAEQTITFTSAEWQKILDGKHTLTIFADDGTATTSEKTEFIKNNRCIAFMSKAFDVKNNTMPTKAVISPAWVLPAHSKAYVWITNNGNDGSSGIQWEDCMYAVEFGGVHLFSNQTKTNANWGVRVKAELYDYTVSVTAGADNVGVKNADLSLEERDYTAPDTDEIVCTYNGSAWDVDPTTYGVVIANNITPVSGDTVTITKTDAAGVVSISSVNGSFA